MIDYDDDFEWECDNILTVSRSQATGAQGGNMWYEPIIDPEKIRKT